MLERLVILGMLVGAYLILSCRGSRVERDEFGYSLHTYPQKAPPMPSPTEENLGSIGSQVVSASRRLYPGAVADIYLTSYRDN